ncbi:MAG TPA: FtsX-like permease family protein [Acidimicrobiales bacterium]|nr:FtsX-like permease family protein [Acidimicrobiales bacterium]
MWRVTIKGLLAHKLRLALTALAIVLGVTFVTGTLVLTDTLHNTFTNLFDNVYQHVDFEVRGKAVFSESHGSGAARPQISESLLHTVRSVPGVDVAEGSVSGYAQFVAPDGKAVTTNGAPTIGTSLNPSPRMASLHIVQGREPTTSTEVEMDEGTAQKYHFRVGEHVRILLPGPTRTFTLTGIVRFGTANNLAGATIAAFTLPTAQNLFNAVGKLDAVDVLTSPGANKAMVQHAIAGTLPPDVEVVTGQTVANEQTNALDQALGFFSTALLVFAFIALFVGAFTIFNTFSIIVGQRTRELAMLRIVGASRGQVFRSMLSEAAIVGLVASAVGLGLGVLGAIGLEKLLSSFGFTLPTGSLVFGLRTVVAAVLVGAGVTVASAISPARRAVRIPPVAAIAEQSADAQESSPRRVVIGSLVFAVGIGALAIGLTVPAIQLVGIGAVGIFVGVGMLAPVVTRPMASIIGRPLAGMLGIAGRLGRENSMRSPRRTAQTAAALMVGLALVSTMAVFGASLSRSATSSIDDAISAEYIITSTSVGGNPTFSAAVGPAAARVPGTKTVSTVYAGTFEFKDSVSQLTAVSAHQLSDTVILRVTSGTGAPALAAGDLLIDTTTANADNLKVGSVVPVKFATIGSTTARIGGIYDPNALIGHYLAGEHYFRTHFAQPLPLAVLVATTSGSPNITAALNHGLSAYPGLKIQTRAQFIQSYQAQVNQLLGLVYALLALAILIALIGIVNTLMLSVFERTHEIGLLRAVGMRRRQIRVMIRAESVILAIFGALVGIVVGTGLGVALSSSLKNQGITDVAVPISSLFVFLVIAALLGLVAASWPARRAAKLDVLAAIAAE